VYQYTNRKAAVTESAEDTILAAFVEITAIGQRYQDELADELSPGLRRGTAQPVLRLHRDGPQRVSALARGLGLDSTTVTRHLDELERRGLVVRRPDDADRRASVVGLTAEAVARLDAADTERRRRLRHLLADWPAADRQSFARLLARFAERPSLVTTGARHG